MLARTTFTYTDQSAGERKVRLTHQWVERSASRPPAAPREPIFPPAEERPTGPISSSSGRPAADPDGDAIADYHFELSDHADMKWPLSMSFAKLISRTADAGQARYTLPEPRPAQSRPKILLARFAHRTTKGLWGPWSETWSFMPRGPAPPLDVTLAVR